MRSVEIQSDSDKAADWISTNLGKTRLLNQDQLNLMLGDSGTIIPLGLERPAHWPQLTAADQNTTHLHEDSIEEPTGPFLFISYADEEKALVEPLVEEIEKLGVRVWWSQNLDSSDEWRREIESQLDRSKLTFVLWTKVSVARRFVRAEAQRAKDQNKYHGIEIGSPTLPLPFGEIQNSRFSGWPEMAKIAETIVTIYAQKTADIDGYVNMLSADGNREPTIKVNADHQLTFTGPEIGLSDPEKFAIAMQGIKDLLEAARVAHGNEPPKSLEMLDDISRQMDQTETWIWTRLFNFLSLYCNESRNKKIIAQAEQVLLIMEADFPHLAERADRLGRYSSEKFDNQKPADLLEAMDHMDGEGDKGFQKALEEDRDALSQTPNQSPSTFERKMTSIRIGRWVRFTAKAEKATKGNPKKKSLAKNLQDSLVKLAKRFVGI